VLERGGSLPWAIAKGSGLDDCGAARDLMRPQLNASRTAFVGQAAPPDVRIGVWYPYRRWPLAAFGGGSFPNARSGGRKGPCPYGGLREPCRVSEIGLEWMPVPRHQLAYPGCWVRGSLMPGEPLTADKARIGCSKAGPNGSGNVTVIT